ncbi:YadA-like family protein [Psychrobacter sp. Ps1]|uniref:YadA family autotransporter adhesin n=1 Tax=Psychrobacter sp. Ps1 TaxID=2790955 RepID=UPI001EDF1D39|nr:ESPR-type extended signal peptide-containing protein [Psychrobacter sp. Ps1]MCG3842384.1 YadA-like family protein [Psychrobacter sp. Ps1]
MNHIFKKVWNKSLGCIVVVSENAKSGGKTNNITGTIARVTGLSNYKVLSLSLRSLVLSIAAVSVTNSWGAVCQTNSGTYGSTSVNPSLACGYRNTASKPYTTAIGSNNVASNESSTAVGFNNAASGGASSAVGASNIASGLATTAVGYYNRVNANNSTAVGNNNLVLSENSSVFGNNSQATAIGATAIGNNSLADEANTVSVGKAGAEKRITNVANATLSSTSTDAVTGRQLFSVDARVGANETAITGLDGRVVTNTEDIIDLKSGLGGLSAGAVVYDSTDKDSISLVGITGTKISNLQDAELNAISTEAVTGKQLYITNQNIKNTNDAITTAFGGGAGFDNGVFIAPSYSIQNVKANNIGSAFTEVDSQLTSIKSSLTGLKNYVDAQDIAILSTANGYTDQKSSDAITAANGYTDQKSSDAVTAANGYTNQKSSDAVTAANGYTKSQVAAVQQSLEERSQYISINGNNAVNSMPTGNAAAASGSHAIALGLNTLAQGDQTIAIGDGAQASGLQSISIGTGNKVTGNHSGALGDPSVVSGNDSYSLGNNNTVSGDNTFVVGNNVSTSATNAVVLGNNSSTNRDNTVAVGSATVQRQIVNVAAGTADTDAVNVSQLQSAQSNAITTSQTYTDTKFANLNDTFYNYAYENEHRFQEIDERFERQGAMSAAMLNMATSTASLQGKNRVGVGFGVQGSEQAVSVGYQRAINPNASISLGGAFTQKETSGGVGLGFSW